MYATLHSILAVYYGLLPVAGLLVALRGAARRQSAAPLVRFLVTCCSGIILGTALIILHSVLSRGHVPVWRIFQTWYFVIDLLLTLGILRWIAREGTWRLMRVRRDLAGWPIAPDSARASIAFIAQGILLTAIGLPLIAAAFMVHRLPVDSGLTPASAAGCVFQNVEFPATDGVAVAGWWVPAEPTASNPRDGRRTVLMAFDLGDDLPRQAGLMRVLVNAGYNVLAFDLRCHGSSGGQWAGLGDVERCDILGAVRWLKMIHPDECERIDGIGGGIAGAALIAAATDPSAQGQAIDAIAVFDTYAEVSSFAKSVADDRLAQPFRGWALNVMLPIASAHAGSDLKRFSPARLAPRLWPRPILVIHARGDRIVPFDQGLELFRTATFPKESLWLSGDHDDVYRNRQGAAEVLYFFDNARAVPAI